MGYASYMENIIESRSENDALVVHEFQYSTRNPHRMNSTDVEPRDFPVVSPEEKAWLAEFLRAAMERNDERLSREMTLVYQVKILDPQRAKVFPVGYMTKREASDLVRGLADALLLDLDPVYGGLLHFGGYIYLSEDKFIGGLQRYGSEITCKGPRLLDSEWKCG